MAIVDLFVKSDSSPLLSADDATVQHQMALLLHGDYTKWAWLSFSRRLYILWLQVAET